MIINEDGAERTPHVGDEFFKGIGAVIHSGRVRAVIHGVVNTADFAGISGVVAVARVCVCDAFTRH